MTIPVTVLPLEGQFTAALLGAPEVRTVGATRTEAVDALKAEIALRIRRGELISLEVAPEGIGGLAGEYADDPTLREISADAYRDRDNEANG